MEIRLPSTSRRFGTDPARAERRRPFPGASSSAATGAAGLRRSGRRRFFRFGAGGFTLRRVRRRRSAGRRLLLRVGDGSERFKAESLVRGRFSRRRDGVDGSMQRPIQPCNVRVLEPVSVRAKGGGREVKCAGRDTARTLSQLRSPGRVSRDKDESTAKARLTS